VPGPGRNEPCPCGSGRKTKRCCGQLRGPSEEQLARARVATLAADVVHDIAHLSEEALEILWEGLFGLPAVDLSLQVRVPDLITPELQRLRDAAIDDDPDRGWEELRVVTDQIDTPQQRARLADAIVLLRDEHRLTRAQAAYAIYHLSTPSQHLLAASLIHAIAVSVGASPTPAGVLLAA